MIGTISMFASIAFVIWRLRIAVTDIDTALQLSLQHLHEARKIVYGAMAAQFSGYMLLALLLVTLLGMPAAAGGDYIILTFVLTSLAAIVFLLTTFRLRATIRKENANSIAAA